uniref:Cytochrome P450 20A1 n=1 Tax=Sinocyclocheilus rhinocerous TaxID=307959 RepID=A0A673FRK5_9TELE
MLDFAIFAVTFVIVLIGAVLYLYPSSRSASGVPGLNPTEEKDGNLQDIVNKGSLHEFLVGLHDEFGSVASFWFGGRPVVSLGALVEELVDKWASYPKSQHTPLCAHLLGLAMKAVTQLAMGSRFGDDAEIIRFRKNHEAIWSEIGKGYLDGSLEKSSSRKAHYESGKKAAEQHLKVLTLFLIMMEDGMVFTLAGCVITANLCIWAVHFLSVSEAVQERLYHELVEVLGEEPVTLEKIPQLRYCQQVLNETVRTAKLTPMAARLQEVEGKVDQHVIPKETLVIYALGVVLQDADTWSLPYRFNPDRFADESVMKSFSLLGFSGSQACPELRFAYTVAAVLLSTLVRRLRLHRVEGQVVEARYELVTTPKDDTWITVSKRN